MKIALKYYRRRKGIARIYYENTSKIGCKNATLVGASVFSTLVLKSGFWQVQMPQDSQQKTAFATQNGLYEFLTMPFRLVNSGASFQRLMGHILRGLEYHFALIYIDDSPFGGSF